MLAETMVLGFDIAYDPADLSILNRTIFDSGCWVIHESYMYICIHMYIYIYAYAMYIKYTYDINNM